MVCSQAHTVRIHTHAQSKRAHVRSSNAAGRTLPTARCCRGSRTPTWAASSRSRYLGPRRLDAACQRCTTHRRQTAAPNNRRPRTPAPSVVTTGGSIATPWATHLHYSHALEHLQQLGLDVLSRTPEKGFAVFIDSQRVLAAGRNESDWGLCDHGGPCHLR